MTVPYRPIDTRVWILNPEKKSHSFFVDFKTVQEVLKSALKRWKKHVKYSVEAKKYCIEFLVNWLCLKTVIFVPTMVFSISGQVHLVCLVHLVRLVSLVRLVCLHMDNFCLFLRQQTDKWQYSVCTMSKRQMINPNVHSNFPEPKCDGCGQI